MPDGNLLLTGGQTNGTPTYIQGVSVISAIESLGFCTADAFTQRSSHTATLLPNGLVLVAGGGGAAGYLSTTFLYNPLTQTCTVGPSLANARALHTATLTQNGTVLFLGGVNGAGAVSATEIYTPSADGSGIGSFAADASLNLLTARYGHTATLLKSSGVFVAGGTDGTTYFSNTEIFNPFGSTLQRVSGPSIQGRAFHTSTLLNNGDVLFAGGYNKDNSGNPQVSLTSERYSSETGTISPASTLINGMPYALAQHSAALDLIGQVSLVGGIGAFPPSGHTLGFTLTRNYPVTNSTVVITPATNTTGTVDATVSTVAVSMEGITIGTPATAKVLQGKLLFSGTYSVPINNMGSISMTGISLDMTSQEPYKGKFRPGTDATAFVPTGLTATFTGASGVSVDIIRSTCTLTLASTLDPGAERAASVDCHI
ncbi:MAG TPA: kelch repeat-containing protein, partial [Elusimicrobiales bacterium]|nr:kelch repeat-containing protein [Elusimicrobiales bacterium]